MDERGTTAPSELQTGWYGVGAARHLRVELQITTSCAGDTGKRQRYGIGSTRCSCGNGNTASAARMASGLSRCSNTPISSASTSVPLRTGPRTRTPRAGSAPRKAMPLTGCMAQKPIRTPRGAPAGWRSTYVVGEDLVDPRRRRGPRSVGAEGPPPSLPASADHDAAPADRPEPGSASISSSVPSLRGHRGHDTGIPRISPTADLRRRFRRGPRARRTC